MPEQEARSEVQTDERPVATEVATLRLDPELKRKLELLAEEEGVSLSALMRQLAMQRAKGLLPAAAVMRDREARAADRTGKSAADLVAEMEAFERLRGDIEREKKAVEDSSGWFKSKEEQRKVVLLEEELAACQKKIDDFRAKLREQLSQERRRG